MGQEKNEIVCIDSIKPDNYLIDNTKIMKEIVNDLIGNPMGLEVAKKNGKKFYIIVESSFDELLDDKNFSAFDRCVYNSTTTLWNAGNNLITPEMIWRTMTGDTDNLKPAPQILGAITKSINKMRMTNVDVDYTEQAKLYGKEVDKFTISGTIINADIINVQISGKKKKAYKFYRAPIFYDYSKLFGHVITVPRELLQTKDKVRNTKEVIVIREYLIGQIAQMKNEKYDRKNKIRYDGILKLLEISEETHSDYNKKVFVIRNHCKAILSGFKEQKFINDFTEYKTKSTFTGIEIFF